jgi:membrane-bound serine protease (ClpP class)
MDRLDPLVWSALLMLVGCGLIVLEVFVPSGGILGFLAATAVFSAVVLAFYHHGPAVGFGFVTVAVIALPITLALAFKYWPQTPMGKRFLLGLPTEEEESPNEPRQLALKQLVGKVGTAKTPMLLSGSIFIEGRTIDAVSQGLAIEAGQPVVVVEVRANRVVVRHAEEEDLTSAGEKKPQDDVLSQPLDALGLDSLDEPLA